MVRATFCCFLYRCHDASERAIRWSKVRGWPGLCGWSIGFEPLKVWDDDDVETEDEEGRRSRCEKETRRKRTMPVARRMVWERSKRKAVMMAMMREEGEEEGQQDGEENEKEEERTKGKQARDGEQGGSFFIFSQ